MIDAGDKVLVVGRKDTSRLHGNVGRVVVRRPVDVELNGFEINRTVYGVEFDFEPGHHYYFYEEELEVRNEE